MNNYKKLKIGLELLEDAHIGTGAGGDMTVDAFCQIDKDGFPMIPASQVKGIMKDVTENFGILDKNKTINIGTETISEIDELFGKEGYDKQGKMVLGSFYCIKEKKKNSDEDKPSEDYFTIWQRTAMENERKIADDDSLRSFEFVKAGTKFESFVLLPEEYAVKIEQIFKKTDTIGHSRTRGSGLCRITITHPEEDNPTKEATTDKIRIYIKNLDSVCLPSRKITSGAENFIPTERYIRGQRLKGAIAAYIAEHFGDKEAEFVFDDEFKITDAMPFKYDSGSYEVIPVPMSFQKNKFTPLENVEKPENKPHWSFDYKKEYIDLLNTEKKGNDKLSRLKNGETLCRKAGDAQWQVYIVPIIARMRNQLNKGEKTDLFTEEHIQEDTVFAFDLHINDLNQFNKTMKEIMNGKHYLRLGRGGRPFKIIDFHKIEEKKVESKEKYILFASDTILRDKNLNFYTGIDQKVLDDIFGEKRYELIDNTHVESIRISGFNAASGFVKNPKIGIKAGSIILVKDNEPSKSISEFIGEDSDWGFGKIVVMKKGIKWDETLKYKQEKNEQKRIVSEVKKEVEDIKEILKKLTKSHLQWVRSEINYLRYQKSEKINDTLAAVISKKADKLGGKDFSDVTKKLEKVKGYSNEVFEVGLREAILVAKDKGGN